MATSNFPAQAVRLADTDPHLAPAGPSREGLRLERSNGGKLSRRTSPHVIGWARPRRTTSVLSTFAESAADSALPYNVKHSKSMKKRPRSRKSVHATTAPIDDRWNNG